MWKIACAASICMILLALAAPGSAASPGYRTPDTISVNFGDYPSAEAAANSQDAIDWYDDDQVPDTVCTEALAAVELV